MKHLQTVSAVQQWLCFKLIVRYGFGADGKSSALKIDKLKTLLENVGVMMERVKAFLEEHNVPENMRQALTEQV